MPVNSVRSAGGADCLSYLGSLLPSLKGVDQKIAQYVLESPEEFVNMTTARLAKTLDISEGSIIHFCQKYGYNGFTALKIAVAMSIQSKNRFVIGDVAVDTGDVYSVTSQVFSAISTVLQQTLSILDRRELDHAVDLIQHARKIEFYGLGTSAPLVEDAYYRFMRIGYPAQACTDPHIMTISASQTKPGDLAIAVSHTGRSIQTVDALRLARNQGASTICITSYTGSPITQYADAALITSPLQEDAVVKEATVARMAHIALLDSLCTYLAMQNSEKTAVSQEELMELLQKQRY